MAANNMICKYSFPIGDNETPHSQIVHVTSYDEQTVQKGKSVIVSKVIRMRGNILDHLQKYWFQAILSIFSWLSLVLLKIPAYNLLSMVDPKNQHPQMLILTPSASSAKLITAYLRSHGCMVALTIHEQSKWPKRQKITTPVIVGTPGITLDYAQKYKCFDLSTINVVIVDEVGELIKVQGYHDQTIRIARGLTGHCKVVLFLESDDQTDQLRVQDFGARLRSLPNIQVSTRPYLTYMNHGAGESDTE
ncbi:ATP-dependent RNA helicase DDX19A-like isoform X2 [Ptychodera flava]|uniref:ATP-dependent RNA helicase DDX19A-like isoform X2 n=1 Tax=Ptychodera flava TaxID=63121 RepID=UPI003969D970